MSHEAAIANAADRIRRALEDLQTETGLPIRQDVTVEILPVETLAARSPNSLIGLVDIVLGGDSGPREGWAELMVALSAIRRANEVLEDLATAGRRHE